MHDLNELRQRLQTQRPVPWDQLPDFALYMDQVLSYMDRQVEEGYAAFCASLDNALNLTADEMADRTGEDSLADSAIHFALLSYAAGVASSRYVAALRERQEAEHPGKVKKGKERD